MRGRVLVGGVIAIGIISGWFFLRSGTSGPSESIVDAQSHTPEAPPPNTSGSASVDVAASENFENNNKSKPIANFLDVVGSKDAKWEDIYKRGMAAGAHAEQQFSALKVLEVCAPPLLNAPYAELPGASEELIAKVNSARAMIEARCAAIWKEGADRVRRDWMSVKGKIEASTCGLYQTSEPEEDRRGRRADAGCVFTLWNSGPLLGWA